MSSFTNQQILQFAITQKTRTRQSIKYMETSELFSINFSNWTSTQKEQVQIFFLFNQFFSKFYQQKKFQQIVKMCYFRKINPNEVLHLQNNNRPEAVILLSGSITIKKKQIQNAIKGKKKHKNKNQINQIPELLRTIAKCTQYNQVFRLNSQCIIQSIGQSKAQIIFVPCSLYNNLIEKIQLQRVQKIQIVLQRFFKQLRKKDLRSLSETNCLFKQFRMNNYIYRATDKPEDVFILLQGMVKLEKPGFSHKIMRETILINAENLFGEKDIKNQQRQQSATCCTAHVEVLSIPKNAFLKYVGQFYYSEKDTLNSNKISVDLPRTFNLRINHKKSRYLDDSFILQEKTKKSSRQKSRQYDLIKNSHMLLDMSPKQKKKFSIRSSNSLNQVPQYNKLIKSRNKLHRSIKKNKNQFDIDNSLEKQLNLHK